MLVTESFILLNYPKTGSTFARTAIKEIYQRRVSERSAARRILDRLGIMPRPFIRELMLPNIMISGVQRPADQHGTYSQIPPQYRDREIVTICRNPYSRFISTYEFGWWREHPPINSQLIVEHFPQFPDLSLDDYVRFSELAMRHGRLKGKDTQARVGNQTVQFIQMFFRNPPSILDNITDEYIDSDRIFEDIAPVTFLKQETLNQDLADYLAGHGFTRKELDFVRARDKINVTPDKTPDAGKLWTQCALDYVRNNERLIFRILEARGIHYNEP